MRRSGGARTPVERLQADLAATLDVYMEAGLLSPSDLQGEISMLRSVLRRVFDLTSEISNGLERRDLARQEGTESHPQLQAKMGERAVGNAPGNEEQHWEQQRFLDFPDLPNPRQQRKVEPKQEPGVDNLELWLQTLESLSKGAMRLANLMRTHQVLNRGEGETGTPEDQAAEIEKIGESFSQITKELRKKQMEEARDG